MQVPYLGQYLSAPRLAINSTARSRSRREHVVKRTRDPGTEQSVQRDPSREVIPVGWFLHLQYIPPSSWSATLFPQTGGDKLGYRIARPILGTERERGRSAQSSDDITRCAIFELRHWCCSWIDFKWSVSNTSDFEWSFNCEKFDPLVMDGGFRQKCSPRN